MMKFDRILAQAEALLVEHPVRTELTEAEIKRIADYFYAHELGADEELREEGMGSDPVFSSVHRQLVDAGIEFETPFEVAEETGSGLSVRMMHKIEEDASDVNKHRSWTPGLREANLLIYFVNLADNRGPDRRRPGPHPGRISSRYIKALRSSELGSRFGAYSHSNLPTCSFMAPAANDSCSSLHAARSLCLRPFNSENQYFHFRTMTYRLENRGGRFHGKRADPL
jgi:hypothetical protein